MYVWIDTFHMQNADTGIVLILVNKRSEIKGKQRNSNILRRYKHLLFAILLNQHFSNFLYMYVVTMYHSFLKIKFRSTIHAVHIQK